MEMIAELGTARSYLDIETELDRIARHKRIAEKEAREMVTLHIYYHDPADDIQAYHSDPMPVNEAMARVMKFVQSGVDVINRPYVGDIQVLLLQRVTGITITPAAAN